MTLTVGRAPFTSGWDGQLNFDPPKRVVLVEPLGRRLRATRGTTTVIDTDDAQLVHVTGQLARYAIPKQDVHVPAEPHPDVDDHVTVAWDTVDAWYEEDERVFVHPRDPYHRIDCLPTSRRVQVAVAGQVLAESTRATALYETALPVRYYLPPEDVRLDLLQPSSTTTECAYKGTADHFAVTLEDEHLDVAWIYELGRTRREGEPVAGRIAFYNERVDLTVDGQLGDRPETEWSPSRTG